MSAPTQTHTGESTFTMKLNHYREIITYITALDSIYGDGRRDVGDFQDPLSEGLTMNRHESYAMTQRDSLQNIPSNRPMNRWLNKEVNIVSAYGDDFDATRRTVRADANEFIIRAIDEALSELEVILKEEKEKHVKAEVSALMASYTKMSKRSLDLLDRDAVGHDRVKAYHKEQEDAKKFRNGSSGGTELVEKAWSVSDAHEQSENGQSENGESENGGSEKGESET